MIDYIELSEPDIVRILGERFRDYRLSSRMTQKELAQKTGISYKTISNFESGTGRNITMVNFLAMLRAVGMLQNVEELLPELPASPYMVSQPTKAQGRIRHAKEDK